MAAVTTSMLLLAGAVAGRAERAQAAATGSISGIVTGPDGAGVAASVFATPFDGSPGGASATSGADGKYSLTGLTAGSYRVTFLAADFGLAYYPGTNDFFAAAAVAVTDGADTAGIDQHYTATGGISGRITDAGDSALAGATVAVTGTSGFGGIQVTSGADGTYAATGLADGTYWVNVSAPGHVSQYFPHAADLSGATPVTVAGGAVTGAVDVTLPLAGAISGRVTGSDGAPAAAVIVTATAGSRTGAASTAADGSYTIDGLPGGDYTVAFAAAGSPGVVEYFDDVDDPAQATPVAVTVGATTMAIDATLGPDPSLGGTVRGVGDAPLAGATVTATSETGAVTTATTDAGGRYLFTRLADGDYTVAFSAAGYPVRYYIDAADVADATPVTVAKHHPVADIDGRLRQPVNHAPYAVDDQASAREGFGPVTIDVLANDTDADGDPLRIASVSETERGGTVTCSTTACVYLPPDDGLIDHDQFTYTVTDGALTDQAVVSVRLRPNAQTHEGDHGAHRVHMTAVLSARDDADTPVQLSYCVQPGTAGGADVVLKCGSATVAPGTDRASLAVWVKGDRRVEGVEYAIVDVTAVGGQLWDSHLTLVIHDDDVRRPRHGRY